MPAEVRAGRAFVEMLIKDESVQQSLNDVRMKLRAFGAAVDATGTQSMVTLGSSGTIAVTSVGSSVGVLTALMAVLRSTVYGVGNAFRVAFGIVTSSVTKAAIGIGAMALVVNRFGGRKSMIGGLLNGFLNSSQTTEAVGRWTRFFGLITGSRVFGAIGNKIERIGLGAAIIRGFQNGGLVGGITSTLGAAFRSTRSILLTGIGSVLTAPIRAMRGVGQAVGVIGPAAAVAAGPVNGLTGSLTRASVAAGVLGGTQSAIGRFAMALRSVVMYAPLLTAAITGPAFLAAKAFATSAAEITAKAKETGKSIAELVADKYGQGSLISADDIRAGKELSDVMKALRQAVATAWAQIGIAALPVLKQITEFGISAAQAMSGLLSENRGLIGSAIAVAARVGGAAAGILAVWSAATMAGPALALLTSPLGLLVAGIVAVAIAFPSVRAAAMDVFEFLFGNFGELLSIVQQTVQGVMDALAGGSIETAARVLWAGLYAAWLKGTEGVRAVYRQMVNNIASTGIDAWAGLQKAFVNVTSFLGDAWQVFVEKFMAVWKMAQNSIAGGFAKVIAKMTGQNVNEVLETLSEMQGTEGQARESQFAQQMQERETLARERLKDIETERQAMQDALAEDFAAREKGAKAELAAAMKEFTDAKAAAAALKAKRFAPVDTATKSAEFASQIGTFSGSISGRIGIAGVSPLQKGIDATARNTEQIAKNTANMGTAFV